MSSSGQTLPLFTNTTVEKVTLVQHKYSVSQEFQNVVTADFRLAKLETAVYNNNAEQIKKAISDLKGIGIEIEVR